VAWEDKLNINLNQNLWGLVVAFGGLAAAEYWQLVWLKYLTALVAAGTTLSLLVCLGFYTWHYCIRKYAQACELKTKMNARSTKALK